MNRKHKPEHGTAHPVVALLDDSTRLAALLRELASRVPSGTSITGRSPATDLPAPHPGLVVTLTDTPAALARATAQRHTAARGLPWLPVHAEQGAVLIGPVSLPGVPGCSECAAHRRTANRESGATVAALREAHGETLDDLPSAPIVPPAARAAGALAADEVSRIVHGTGEPRTLHALLRLDGRLATVTRHPVLPDPRCSACTPGARHDGRALLPLPGAAVRTVKPAASAYRLQPLDAELTQRHTDPLTGRATRVTAGVQGGCVVATATRAPSEGAANGNHGFGRALDFTTARLTAVAEALERAAGERPEAGGEVVRAPYTSVAGHALDPAALGLYPDRRHDLPDFPFRRYRPNAPMAWVRGHSLASGAPVLVPLAYAYYGSGEDEFVYECSNGCAMGSGPTEAALHGLLEVAERDAFLLTWYARLPGRRVDLDACLDQRIPLLVERVQHETGYRLSAYFVPTEQRIPAFWMMACDTRPSPHRPRTLNGAAAHIDPEQALLGGLLEVGSAVDGLADRYDPQRAARMAASPDEVREMGDHAQLYGHPDAAARLSFLTVSGPLITPWEVADLCAWPASADLAGDLAEAAGRYLAHGMDVVAVDQTTAEQAASGLTSVKVIVPGTLPMTFGHRYRRVDGLPRLQTLPRLLGHRDHDLKPSELNPHPHPFP
ncbi:TOMM precursor leader peptide-binding protein [Streptoverticillium reticulum]|uniref:TOMM precursor leader peptide-binding protein n=1 Tax=Streptoverticillium reticulum TaxID=1433415 RepID=UPI0039BF541C